MSEPGKHCLLAGLGLPQLVSRVTLGTEENVDLQTLPGAQPPESTQKWSCWELPSLCYLGESTGLRALVAYLWSGD